MRVLWLWPLPTEALPYTAWDISEHPGRSGYGGGLWYGENPRLSHEVDEAEERLRGLEALSQWNALFLKKLAASVRGYRPLLWKIFWISVRPFEAVGPDYRVSS